MTASSLAVACDIFVKARNNVFGWSGQDEGVRQGGAGEELVHTREVRPQTKYIVTLQIQAAQTSRRNIYISLFPQEGEPKQDVPWACY